MGVAAPWAHLSDDALQVYLHCHFPCMRGTMPFFEALSHVLHRQQTEILHTRLHRVQRPPHPRHSLGGADDIGDARDRHCAIRAMSI